MRPVDKGKVPENVTFKKYQEAEPYLEKRIGPYCSYCEFHIQHVPEVEHRESKSQGGDVLEWENLLLSCKYCNTRKSKKVNAGDKDKYLWPDEDDTFHAYSYGKDIPELNQEYLLHNGKEIQEKAENLYTLLNMGHIPTKPSDKDKRYSARSEARNNAIESLHGWEIMKNTPEKELYLAQTVRLAQATGFFSVWMEIFKNEPEVEERLIDAFKGTRKEVIKQQP